MSKPDGTDGCAGFGCRRVLIFPKGNNVDHLSMYLDVADSGNLPYGWSRSAHFSLAIVNQIQQKFTTRKGISFHGLMLFFQCIKNAIHHGNSKGIQLGSFELAWNKMNALISDHYLIIDKMLRFYDDGESC